jgi:hypothetical protein
MIGQSGGVQNQKRTEARLKFPRAGSADHLDTKNEATTEVTGHLCPECQPIRGTVELGFKPMNGINGFGSEQRIPKRETAEPPASGCNQVLFHVEEMRPVPLRLGQVLVPVPFRTRDRNRDGPRESQQTCDGA